MTQQILLEQVGNLDKLATDLNFRNAFIANPLTVLSQALPNLNLPSNIKIHVHENTSSEMHVILVPDEEMVFSDQLETAVEQVLDKAVQDTQFKKLLVADPKGTLAKQLPEFYVPEDFKMFFHENTATEIHLLIPPLRNDSDELSEAELDAVAGGKRRGPHVGRKRGGKGPKCRSQRFRRR